MKKFLILSIIALLATYLNAQITYSNDTTNLVSIEFNGTSATATISTNIKDYVTPTISGANVSIVQSANVSELTCGEITYSLNGATTSGSFYLEGSYKATINLYGVTITNPSGPAINIQNGKRIAISSKKGTVSTLTDGKNGNWKGALMCKGHTEFKGYGTLNIYGNTAHGIWSKEYIEVKNCTINVLSAVKDGINCNQYFLMESGVVTVSGYGDDGIQVSLKLNDTSAINTGNFTIVDGAIRITTDNSNGSAIKTEGTKNQQGGSIHITTTGIENKLEENLFEVFDVLGKPIGIFSNRDELNNLPQGIYILRTNTNTIKIII